MKILEKKHQIKTEGFENSVEFSIGNKAKVFELMATKLYTKPEEAIVREYSCNAVDSQIKAKNTEPFEVHIPTYSSPYFVVRDWGTGLDPSKIDELFSVLFESDKSNTNKLIGALGLGRLSAMSITDKFTFESWYEGRKYTYCVYLNENHVPVVSTTNEKGEPSDESSGCRITIAVPSKHFYEFERAAKSIFRFFLIQPKINIKPNYEEILYEEDKFTITKGLYSEYYAVMGGVIYPIDKEFLPNSQFYNTKVFLKFGIGDISVKTSREALVYDDKTKKAIKIAFEGCIKNTKSHIQEATKGLKGWELSVKKNELYKKFTWAGLDQVEIKCVKEGDHTNNYARQEFGIYKLATKTLSHCYTLIPSQKIRFFEKDVEKEFFNSLIRWQENTGLSAIVIHKSKKVMDLLGIEDKDIEKLSSIIEKEKKDKVTRVVRTVCEIRKSRYKNENFLQVEVDLNDIKYYVVREQNDIKHQDKLFSVEQIHAFALQISKLQSGTKVEHTRYEGLSIDGDKVYAILKTQVKNLPTTAKNVVELFKELAIKKLCNNNLQIIADRESWNLEYTNEEDLPKLKSKLIDEVLKERNAYLAKYEEVFGIYSCLLQLEQLQLPKPKSSKMTELKQKFPLIEFLYFPHGKHITKEVSQFIDSTISL